MNKFSVMIRESLRRLRAKIEMTAKLELWPTWS